MILMCAPCMCFRFLECRLCKSSYTYISAVSTRPQTAEYEWVDGWEKGAAWIISVIDKVPPTYAVSFPDNKSVVSERVHHLLLIIRNVSEGCDSFTGSVCVVDTVGCASTGVGVSGERSVCA